MSKILQAMQEHIEKFKKEPLILGIFFDNPKQEYLNIINAIKTNKPYNEYDLLSDEEKKAFDKGELLF